MEVTRCARCGVFYTNGGYVCAKCQAKDNLELSTFKNFIEKNDSELTTLEDVSG